MRKLWLLLPLFVVAPAAAQDGGRIVGTVTAARGGAPVPGVNVIVAGTLFGAVTDADGRFRLDEIPAGRYSVQVVALGYRPESRSVDVPAGTEVQVDFRLRPPEADLAEAQAERIRPSLQPLVLVEARTLKEMPPFERDARAPDVPGAPVGRRDALGGPAVVRGLAEPQLGYFVDGIRFAPGGAYDIGSPLDRFAPAAFTEVRVVKGPYALAWGSGLLGGLWAETTTETERRREAVVGYGSNLRSVDAAGSIDGRHGAMAYGLFGAYRTGEDYADGHETDVPADLRSGMLHGRFVYRGDGHTRVALTGGYVDRRGVDAPGRIVDADAVRSTHASLRVQSVRASGLVRGVDALAYGQHTGQDLTNASRPVLAIEEGTVETTHAAFGGRVAVQLAVAGLRLLEAGGDVHSDAYDAERRSVFAPEPRAAVDGRVTQGGLFVHAAQQFRWLDAEATVRADAVSATGSVNPVFLQESSLDAGDLDASEMHLSGSLALSAYLSPRVTASAGVGSVVRTATVDERYGEAMPYGRAHHLNSVWGQPRLDPERSTQADAWLTASFPRLDVHLGVFARRLSRAITLEPTRLDQVLPPEQDPDVIRFTNGRETALGGEAVLRYRLVGEYVTVNAAAGYVRATDDVLDEPALGGSPVSMRFGGRLQAPADLFFFEGRLHLVTRHTRVAASRGDVENDGYATADLRFGMRLPRRSSLLIGVDNFWDAAYAHPLNALDPFTLDRLPEPGRVVYLRVRTGF